MAVGLDEVLQLIDDIKVDAGTATTSLESYNQSLVQLNTDWGSMKPVVGQVKTNIESAETLYSDNRPQRDTLVSSLEPSADISMGRITQLGKDTDLETVLTKVSGVKGLQDNVEDAVVKVKNSLR